MSQISYSQGLHMLGIRVIESSDTAYDLIPLWSLMSAGTENAVSSMRYDGLVLVTLYRSSELVVQPWQKFTAQRMKTTNDRRKISIPEG
ncbi:hypothetical protein Tco_0705160 [Tanacetum coccineum]|uniref:Uncharacterized protein n=1 Tax=Tanacetum coccineum TaxID=301880 RepID=A0ABQ4Y406_9ASTR